MLLLGLIPVFLKESPSRLSEAELELSWEVLLRGCNNVLLLSLAKLMHVNGSPWLFDCFFPLLVLILTRLRRIDSGSLVSACLMADPDLSPDLVFWIGCPVHLRAFPSLAVLDFLPIGINAVQT